MFLYKQAQKELYGNIVEEYPKGFICFEPVTKDGGIYVQLLFVSKEFRSQGVARQMLKDICNKYDAKYVTGFIDLNTSNYKDTLIKHLKTGYDIVDATRDKLTVAITRETLFNGK